MLGELVDVVAVNDRGQVVALGFAGDDVAMTLKRRLDVAAMSGDGRDDDFLGRRPCQKRLTERPVDFRSREGILRCRGADAERQQGGKNQERHTGRMNHE